MQRQTATTGDSVFFLMAALALVGCGVEPVTPAAQTVDPAYQAPWSGHPELIDFLPKTAVSMTELHLQLSDDVSGCFAANRCEVTVGGQAAEVFFDEGGLHAYTPRFTEGDQVCVVLDGHTSCVGGFEMLAAPVVTAATYQFGRCQNGLTIDGDGFPADAQVTLDGLALDVTVLSSTQLFADVPSTVEGGDKQVIVFSPSHGRCGTPTEPVVVTLPSSRP